MACKNCQCQTEDAKEQPVSDIDVRVALKQGVRNMYRIDDIEAHLKAIESFLISNFPLQLGPVECAIGTQQWLDAKERQEADDRRLKHQIEELQKRGYLVAKPEVPPEPTLEASIRDVVLANTVIK